MTFSQKIHKTLAIFVSITLSLDAAPALASAPKESTFSLPEEFGSIESFHFQSHPERSEGSKNGILRSAQDDKRIYFIQDAHNSLEAQENIAKMIEYLVEKQGIKTVFEEGYEGPVPTDKYFGWIKDQEVRRKAAYFLMDKLRLGGAEYAHINRFNPVVSRQSSVVSFLYPRRDFKLIGADSNKLHRQNIQWYRKAAKTRERTDRTLNILSQELNILIQQDFPAEFKSWMKLKERLDRNEIDLLDYFKRSSEILTKHNANANRHPEAAQQPKDPDEILRGVYPRGRYSAQDDGRRAQDDPKTFFKELHQLEEDIIASFLTDEKDRKIFEYHKILSLLKRLNDIEVSASEYEAAKSSLKNFNLKEFVGFLVQNTKRSLVVRRDWEEDIQNAVHFYKAAERRNDAVAKRLGEFQASDETAAVLVFGGFHKDSITGLLKEKGFSYYVLTPRITAPDKKHEEYYKHLMSVGRYSFEPPFNLARTARAESRIQIWETMPPALAQSELRVITDVIARDKGKDYSLLAPEIERSLSHIKYDMRHRSEARTEEREEESFIGDREEMKNELAKIVGDDAAGKFMDDFTAILSGKYPELKLPAALKKLAWPAVLRSAKRAMPNDIEKLERLIRSLKRYSFFLDKYPALSLARPIIEDERGIVKQSLEMLLNSNELEELHGGGFQEIDKLPRSPLLPDAPYLTWAREILEKNPAGFSLINELKEDEPQPSRILHTFFDVLPSDTQAQAARTIMDRLNQGISPDVIDWDVLGLYFAVVKTFRNRVGLLTNEMSFERLYGFLKDVDVLIIKDYAAMKDIDLFEDDEVDEGEVVRPVFFHLDAVAENAIRFFDYNPGPSMLKKVILLWQKMKTSEGKPLLSDSEANAFQWLVKQIPKEKGNTRDRRRQIHRYLLRLAENRLRVDAGRARDFMGFVIGSIDTNAPRNPEETEVVLNFILHFSNLSRTLQDKFSETALALLKQWREVEGGRRLFIRAGHFAKLNGLIREVLINSLLEDSMTLSAAEKTQLKTHIHKYPDAWQQQNFLETLATYHSFQDEEGKIQTEKFLRQLMKSKVEGDRFVKIPRYRWEDPKIQEMLGKGLIEKLRRGKEVEIEIPKGREGLAYQFAAIKEDILSHLGRGTSDSLNAILSQEKNPDVPEAELENLRNILGEIFSTLDRAEAVSEDKVRKWRERLYPSHLQEPPVWYRLHLAWREIFVNLSQILQVQKIDDSNIERVIFNITDDPVAFVQSGIEPYQTCQRCNEPTGFNGKGRPVNRARQGQFLLAQIIVVRADGTREVASRSILEIAMDHPWLPGDQLFRKIFGESYVLLVERLYQTGLVPSQVMQREILKWAMEDEEISYVAMAGSRLQNGISQRIQLKFIPSDGEVYRDTFSEKFKWPAIDVSKLRKKGSIPEAFMDTQRARSPHPSRSEAREDLGKREEGEGKRRVINELSGGGVLQGIWRQLSRQIAPLEQPLVQSRSFASFSSLVEEGYTTMQMKAKRIIAKPMKIRRGQRTFRKILEATIAPTERYSKWDIIPAVKILRGFAQKSFLSLGIALADITSPFLKKYANLFSIKVKYYFTINKLILPNILTQLQDTTSVAAKSELRVITNVIARDKGKDYSLLAPDIERSLAALGTSHKEKKREDLSNLEGQRSIVNRRLEMAQEIKPKEAGDFNHLWNIVADDGDITNKNSTDGNFSKDNQGGVNFPVGRYNGQSFMALKGIVTERDGRIPTDHGERSAGIKNKHRFQRTLGSIQLDLGNHEGVNSRIDSSLQRSGRPVNITAYPLGTIGPEKNTYTEAFPFPKIFWARSRLWTTWELLWWATTLPSFFASLVYRKAIQLFRYFFLAVSSRINSASFLNQSKPRLSQLLGRVNIKNNDKYRGKSTNNNIDNKAARAKARSDKEKDDSLLAPEIERSLSHIKYDMRSHRSEARKNQLRVNSEKLRVGQEVLSDNSSLSTLHSSLKPARAEARLTGSEQARGILNLESKKNPSRSEVRGIGIKYKWNSKIPNSLRPSLEAELNSALGEEINNVIGMLHPQPAIRKSGEILYVQLPPNLIQQSLDQMKKENLSPSETEATKRLRLLLTGYKLPPLSVPVQLIFATHGHHDVEEARWTIQRLDEIINALDDRSRPVIFWGENVPAFYLNYEFDQFQEQFDLMTEAKRVRPINIQQMLLEEPIPDQAFQILESYYKDELRALKNPTAKVETLGDYFMSLNDYIANQLLAGVNINRLLEEPSFKAYLTAQRSEAYANEALDHLLRGEGEEAIKLLAQNYSLKIESGQIRDIELAQRILQAHAEQPFALHIVVRGSAHQKKLESFLDQSQMAFKAVSAGFYSSSISSASSSYQDENESIGTVRGRRLLIEEFFDVAVLNFFGQNDVPPSLVPAISRLFSSMPNELFDAWLAEVVPQQSKDIIGLGERTWQWLKERQEITAKETVGLFKEFLDDLTRLGHSNLLRSEARRRVEWTSRGPVLRGQEQGEAREKLGSSKQNAEGSPRLTARENNSGEGEKLSGFTGETQPALISSLRTREYKSGIATLTASSTKTSRSSTFKRRSLTSPISFWRDTTPSPITRISPRNSSTKTPTSDAVNSFSDINLNPPDKNQLKRTILEKGKDVNIKNYKKINGKSPYETSHIPLINEEPERKSPTENKSAADLRRENLNTRLEMREESPRSEAREDFNHAPEEELRQALDHVLIGLVPKAKNRKALIQRILDARPYSDWNDLLKVSGVGPGTLKEIQRELGNRYTFQAVLSDFPVDIKGLQQGKIRPSEFEIGVDPNAEDIQQKLDAFRGALKDYLRDLKEKRRYPGLRNLRELARQINPNFDIPLSDFALNSPAAEDFLKFLSAAQKKMLCPLNEYLVIRIRDFSADWNRWVIDADSWKSRPYLGSILWSSRGKWVEGGEKGNFANALAGKYVSIDAVGLDQVNAGYYQALLASTDLPYRLIGEFIQTAGLTRREYQEVILSYIEGEEERHAEDDLFGELRSKEDLSEDAAASPKIVNTILKPDSFIRQAPGFPNLNSLPTYIAQLQVLETQLTNLIELSGQTGGLLKAMERFKDNPKAVYLLFLNQLIRSYLDMQTYHQLLAQRPSGPPNVQDKKMYYAMTGALFLNSLNLTPFFKKNKITNITQITQALEAIPLPARAEKVRELVEVISGMHFWSDVERQGHLSRRSEVRVGEKNRKIKGPLGFEALESRQLLTGQPAADKLLSDPAAYVDALPGQLNSAAPVNLSDVNQDAKIAATNSTSGAITQSFSSIIGITVGGLREAYYAGDTVQLDIRSDYKIMGSVSRLQIAEFSYYVYDPKTNASEKHFVPPSDYHWGAYFIWQVPSTSSRQLYRLTIQATSETSGKTTQSSVYIQVLPTSQNPVIDPPPSLDEQVGELDGFFEAGRTFLQSLFSDNDILIDELSSPDRKVTMKDVIPSFEPAALKNPALQVSLPASIKGRPVTAVISVDPNTPQRGEATPPFFDAFIRDDIQGNPDSGIGIINRGDKINFYPKIVGISNGVHQVEEFYDNSHYHYPFEDEAARREFVANIWRELTVGDVVGDSHKPELYLLNNTQVAQAGPVTLFKREEPYSPNQNYNLPSSLVNLAADVLKDYWNEIKSKTLQTMNDFANARPLQMIIAKSTFVPELNYYFEPLALGLIFTQAAGNLFGIGLSTFRSWEALQRPDGSIDLSALFSQGLNEVPHLAEHLYTFVHTVIHETAGHMQHLIGMDAAVRDELNQRGKDAVASGLYTKTYAGIGIPEEFVAEALTFYGDFGEPRNLANYPESRAQLERYDPVTAALLNSKIFVGDSSGPLPTLNPDIEKSTDMKWLLEKTLGLGGQTGVTVELVSGTEKNRLDIFGETSAVFHVQRPGFLDMDLLLVSRPVETAGEIGSELTITETASGRSVDIFRGFVKQGDDIAWSYHLAGNFQGAPDVEIADIAGDAARLQAFRGALDMLNISATQDRTASVEQIYANYLGHAPDTQGEQFWVGSLLSTQQIANEILASPEYRLRQIYFEDLGRAPDSEGIHFWLDSYAHGISFNNIQHAIQSSQESREKIVRQLYHDWLGREADVTGLAAWTEALGKDASPENIGAAIRASDEFSSRAAQIIIQYYSNLLDRRPLNEEIDYWVKRVRQGASFEDIKLAFLHSSEYQNISRRSEVRPTQKINVTKALDELRSPTMVYIDYTDLAEAFSEEQREELFALAFEQPEKIRLVIYNADVTSDLLKPFRELRQRNGNVWITSRDAEQAYKNTQRDFVKDFDLRLNLHLSKTVPKPDFPNGKSRNEFWRYKRDDARSGLLAAALLSAIYKDFVKNREANRELDGVALDGEGYMTLVSESLRNLIQRSEARRIVAMAA